MIIDPKLAFEAAFGNASDDTPFGRALRRINDGASVLIMVPGNMMAAAGAVINTPGSGWQERGQHSRNAGSSLGKDLCTLRDGVVSLLGWLEAPPENQPRPRIIVHNADMLADESGRLHGGEDYMTAFFALREATRHGQVVALAERRGEAPALLTRLFPEHVSLDEFRDDFFNHLLDAGGNERDCIASRDDLRALSHRLRFLDPVRAVQIYTAIRQEFGTIRPTLAELLRSAAEKTLTLGFTRPANDVPAAVLEGYPERVRTQLQATADHYRLLREAPAACEAGGRRIELTTPGAVLLSGPPGTGKTLAARWLAQEADLPVMEVSGAEIRQVGWGDAERAVRDLFATARQAAPCCIVLDEADDLLGDRDAASGGVASAERSVVNALLKEMDGFKGRTTGVLLVLTTNRRHKLDPALFSRLGANCHLPYPLDREQIATVMATILDDLRIIIPTDLVIRIEQSVGNCRPGEHPAQAVLVERFHLPVDSGKNVQFDKPQARLEAVENLFAPRDIRNALHKLVNPADPARALAPTYYANGDDINRVLNFYR